MSTPCRPDETETKLVPMFVWMRAEVAVMRVLASAERDTDVSVLCDIAGMLALECVESRRVECHGEDRSCDKLAEWAGCCACERADEVSRRGINLLEMPKTAVRNFL